MIRLACRLGVRMARRGWGLGGGRGAVGAHLKSMGSYEMHAWRDAMAIAGLLDETIGARKARQIYERIKKEAVWKFEDSMNGQIAEFIGRSESQRPAVIRKLPDDVTRVCFLTLAILGCVRAKDVMELRDMYRELLAPGRGNRETTRGLYGFANQVQGFFNYEWPEEVFSSMGVDDDVGGDGDEEGVGDGVEQLDVAADLKPTVPPPPAQAQPRTHTEILVSIGKSETVAADAGGGGQAWKLQFVQDESTFVGMTLLAKPMTRERLVKHLVHVSGAEWGRLPGILLFSEGQRDLAAEVNSAAGKEVAALMRKGVGSMACMRWSEDLLRSFKRELELIGESMPTAAELDACKMNTLTSSRADAKDGWKAQRAGFEKWAKTLLVHRGRWTGEATVGAQSEGRSGSDDRDLAKAKRTLTKLEDANRTTYGDALYYICDALLGWRSGEKSLNEASHEAAAALVEYKFRRASDRGGSNYQLDFELDELFGKGSVELDVLEFGVLRLLNGPFESGRPEKQSAGSNQWMGYGQPRRARGWFQAWWCVLEVGEKDGFEEADRWMPSASSLESAAGSVMPEGVTLAMSSGVCRFDRESANEAVSWAAGNDLCQSHGGQLISWIERGGSYHPYDGPGKVDGSRRRAVMVVANGGSSEQVEAARAAWSRAAPQVEARIRTADARGKRQAPPRSLAVSGEAVDFFEPLVMVNERLALMAGRAWNASTRRSTK